MSKLLQTLQSLPFVLKEGARMGAEQSNASQLRSQRDENIPYTSYSISKPIDGDAAGKSSPRLSGRSKPPKDQGTKDPVSKPHDIVVVAEGSTSTADIDAARLDNIPVFHPLIKSSAGLQEAQDVKSAELEKLDSRRVYQLCSRYQDHLKQSAEAVAFDQNALCVRIKEVDYTVNGIYNTLTDRQKKFSKYADQFKKIDEISSALKKIKMNVEQTTDIVERLNSILPQDDRLEPFSMKPPQK